MSDKHQVPAQAVTMRTGGVHINVTPAVSTATPRSCTLSHDPLFVTGMCIMGMALLIVCINGTWAALIYAVLMIVTLPVGGWITGIVVLLGILDCGIIPILIAVTLFFGGKLMLR